MASTTASGIVDGMPEMSAGRFSNLSIEPPVPMRECSDEQLVIGDERAFLELQSPEYVLELGDRCLAVAEAYLAIAYECRDTLVDWGHVEKSRKKKPDLGAALPELRKGR